MFIKSISELQTAKNGRKFFAVEFKNSKDKYDNTPSRTRRVWEDFTDAQGNKFRGDEIFQTLVEDGQKAIGKEVPGAIHCIMVDQEYPLSTTGGMTRQWTGAVFACEHPKLYAEKQAKSARKLAGIPEVV